MSDLKICDKCGVDVSGAMLPIVGKLDYATYAFCYLCSQGVRKEWEQMRREAYVLAGERMAMGK